MSSTIDQAPSVFRRITKAASYLVRNPLRVQYATSMGARFSWFLNQGIALSLTGIDRSSKADEVKMRGNSQGLSVTSVLGALVDAILTDDDDPPTTHMPVQSPDMTDEQRALFGKNFASIIRLFRKDLKHIEEGVYKFPYDMRPTYLPQWGGPQVLSQLQAYVTDRREVLDRWVACWERMDEWWERMDVWYSRLPFHHVTHKFLPSPTYLPPFFVSPCSLPPPPEQTRSSRRPGDPSLLRLPQVPRLLPAELPLPDRRLDVCQERAAVRLPGTGGGG